MTDQSAVEAFCELSQAKATYCRSLDTRDWAALATLMTEDVEFGMTETDSEPEMTHGRDETLAMLQSLVANSKTVHQVHAPEIDLAGDEARVIWAVQDRAVFEADYPSPATGTTTNAGYVKQAPGKLLR